MSDYDILISGGGIAGMTAAAAFGAAGFRVLCVDPAPPPAGPEAPGADLRTTAFLQPARDFLDRAGLWRRLAPHARPLRVMRIVDAGGADGEARATRDFDSGDLGETPFGWNLPNWLLRREMAARLAEMPEVTLRTGAGFAGMLGRDDQALVRLDDGSRITARLVVAADGRGSPARQSAGIGVHTTRFGQKAVVFTVTHNGPHGDVSTEVHQSGGPFTLVPLPDLDGRPASSVVWMTGGPEADRLMALDETAFSAAATARSGMVYGPLTLASRRQVWPIIAQIADRLTAPRLALTAEAAHVVPPIGAQGLNMSINDLACLLDLARAGDDPGAPDVLAAYSRARMPDIRLRHAGIAALNRASQAGAQPLRDLRALGIRAIHDLAPLRRGLMRLGLGAKG